LARSSVLTKVFTFSHSDWKTVIEKCNRIAHNTCQMHNQI
jgi:hypothetical protein